ncbi:MAG: RES domain-containing protein [Bryobacteraceae bacterium]
MSQAFSTPVTRDGSLADYAPTQILAELFKLKGYDGIRHKSLLNEGKGTNLALFDIDSA